MVNLETFDKFLVPMRIIEFILGLTVLALMSAVAHFFNISGSASFLLFCGLWGLLASAILLVIHLKAPATWDPKITRTAIAGTDVVTAIFFFAGFIAAAADTFDCGSGTTFTSYCRVFKAAVAFGSFSWLCWTITSVITVPKAISALRTTAPVAAPVATPVNVENGNINNIPIQQQQQQQQQQQAYPSSSIPSSSPTRTVITPVSAPVVPSAAPVSSPVSAPIVPSAAAISTPVIATIPVPTTPVITEERKEDSNNTDSQGFRDIRLSGPVDSPSRPVSVAAAQ